MKCPKCGVQMSKSEYSEGICPVMCGWEKSREQRLAERANAAKKAAAPVSAPVSAPKAKTSKVIVQDQFEINFHSAGYIEGSGFSIDPGNYERSPRIGLHVVVLSNGKVYAGHGVLNTIADTAHFYAPKTVLKIGRAKLYQVTEEVINYLLERNSYERRSDRERAVQNRNDNVILWLAEIAGIA